MNLEVSVKSCFRIFEFSYPFGFFQKWQFVYFFQHHAILKFQQDFSVSLSAVSINGL